MSNKLEVAFKIPTKLNKLGSMGAGAWRKLMDEALVQAGVIFEQRVKPGVPWVTGRLRNSIGFKVENGVLTVGSLFDAGGGPVEYAAFVEFGTKYMAPRGYFFPVVTASVPDAMREIEASLAEGLARVLGD